MSHFIPLATSENVPCPGHLNHNEISIEVTSMKSGTATANPNFGQRLSRA